MKDSLMEMARKELMIKMKYIVFLNEWKRILYEGVFQQEHESSGGESGCFFHSQIPSTAQHLPTQVWPPVKRLVLRTAWIGYIKTNVTCLF